MAKQRRPRTLSFKLNEPTPKIPGGAERRSIVVNRKPYANIARRERLEQILLAHDLFDADAHRHEMTPEDFILLRQIAREGVMTNLEPAIRNNAILMLGQFPSAENLNLLEELARYGEDFYVRSHALLALGKTGLTLVGPVLRDALGSNERLERQAAERALVGLGRIVGIESIQAMAVGEKRKSVKEGISRVTTMLIPSHAARHKRLKRKTTSSREHAPNSIEPESSQS